MIRRIPAKPLAVAIGALLSAEAHAISIPIAVSSDGKMYSAYRKGDAPTGGACPSGWTCAAMGTATCEFTNTDADTFSVISTALNDEVGKCVVYKTQASTADIHVEGQLVSITGNQGNYAGGGAYFSQGTTSIADYHAQTWWPVIGSMRIKTDVGGAAELGQVGASGTSLSRYFAHEYDDAATDIIRGGEGTNGSTWTQVGSNVTKTLTFDVTYGVWCQSYSTSASSACNFDGVATSNTLETIGAGGGVEDPAIVSDVDTYQEHIGAASIEGQTLASGRREVNVANEAALVTALANALCKDDIRLAAAVFDDPATINKHCVDDEPIIIHGAANFGTTFNDTFTISGTNNTVTGINFSGSATRLILAGTNNRIIGNKITAWTYLYAIAVSATANVGDYGEIAYNECYDHAPYLADPSDVLNQMRMCIRTTEKGQDTFHFDAHVHHNYFHDYTAKPTARYSSGQNDAIEVCESGRAWNAGLLSPAGWYIERNLIERHDQGDGIVDLKCGGVVVWYNTVIDSDGRIDQRYGSGSVFETNYQTGNGTGPGNEGEGGSTIGGGHARIACNYMRDGGISLKAGNLEWNLPQASSTSHNRSFSALVDSNDTSSLKIGIVQAGATLPADDTEVRNHTGTVTTASPMLQTDTTQSGTTAVTCTPAAQRILTSEMVGPSALANASAAYKAARGLN